MVFTLDPSDSQDRVLRSYCGASRFAYNWVIGQVRANLDVRTAERASGVAEDQMTPSLSWSAFSWTTRWTAEKETAAPWWRDVSANAFRSGIEDACAALANWGASRRGARAGKTVGFPKFKSRHKARLAVRFTELNHQLSWLRPDRHGIRLMLPQRSTDPSIKRRRSELEWLHTIQSTSKLYKRVESGQCTIQKVTISRTGGRWQVAFQLRYAKAPSATQVRHHGGAVGIDLGVKHLATLSRVVPGLTDERGHIANPRVLDGELRRLRRLDRAISRCVKGSKNRRRLLDRRARLHGAIAKTRSLHLHQVTNALAGGFDVVAIEDLNVAGMGNRKRHLGRRLADAGLSELRRQLTYKCPDRTAELVVVGRFYPSSKTCSSCGVVKAKLHLGERVFECDTCNTQIDRDHNAAINIEREALRLLDEHQQDVAGLRPETRNADPRPCQTRTVHAAGHGPFEGRTKQPPQPVRAAAA